MGREIIDFQLGQLKKTAEKIIKLNATKPTYSQEFDKLCELYKGYVGGLCETYHEHGGENINADLATVAKSFSMISAILSSMHEKVVFAHDVEVHEIIDRMKSVSHNIKDLAKKQNVEGIYENLFKKFENTYDPAKHLITQQEIANHFLEHLQISKNLFVWNVQKEFLEHAMDPKEFTVLAETYDASTALASCKKSFFSDLLDAVEAAITPRSKITSTDDLEKDLETFTQMMHDIKAFKQALYSIQSDKLTKEELDSYHLMHDTASRVETSCKNAIINIHKIAPIQSEVAKINMHSEEMSKMLAEFAPLQDVLSKIDEIRKDIKILNKHTEEYTQFKFDTTTNNLGGSYRIFTFSTKEQYGFNEDINVYKASKKEILTEFLQFKVASTISKYGKKLGDALDQHMIDNNEEGLMQALKEDGVTYENEIVYLNKFVKAHAIDSLQYLNIIQGVMNDIQIVSERKWENGEVIVENLHKILLYVDDEGKTCLNDLIKYYTDISEDTKSDTSEDVVLGFEGDEQDQDEEGKTDEVVLQNVAEENTIELFPLDQNHYDHSNGGYVEVYHLSLFDNPNNNNGL